MLGRLGSWGTLGGLDASLSSVDADCEGLAGGGGIPMHTNLSVKTHVTS